MTKPTRTDAGNEIAWVQGLADAIKGAFIACEVKATVTRKGDRIEVTAPGGIVCLAVNGEAHKPEFEVSAAPLGRDGRLALACVRTDNRFKRAFRKLGIRCPSDDPKAAHTD